MARHEEKSVHFLKSFIEGEFHLGFWGFVKKGLGFSGSFFVLRSLSLYQLGVYQLLLSFYGIVSGFCFGLFSDIINNDLARSMADNNEAKTKRLFWEYSFIRLGLCIFLAGLAFVLASFLSSHYGYGPEAVAWIRILSIMLLCECLILIMTSFLRLHLKFSITAVRPSAQKMVQAVVLAYLYFFSVISIKEVFLAQLIGFLVALLLVFPPFIKEYSGWHKIRAAKKWFLKDIIFSYGKWEIPRSFSQNVFSNLNPLVIKLFLSTEMVGIFSVANTGISLLKDLLPIRTLPTLMARKINEKEALTSIFIYGTKFYIFLSLVLVAGGAIFYPIGIRFIFPQLSASILLFYLLLPTIVLFAFIKLTNILLVVERRQKFIFAQTLFRQAINIVLLLVFLPIFGISGLAFAQVFSMTIAVFTKYYYLTKTRFIERLSFKQLLAFSAEDKKILSMALRHLFRFLRIGSR